MQQHCWAVWMGRQKHSCCFRGKKSVARRRTFPPPVFKWKPNCTIGRITTKAAVNSRGDYHLVCSVLPCINGLINKLSSCPYKAHVCKKLREFDWCFTWTIRFVKFNLYHKHISGLKLSFETIKNQYCTAHTCSNRNFFFRLLHQGSPQWILFYTDLAVFYTEGNLARPSNVLGCTLEGNLCDCGEAQTMEHLLACLLPATWSKDLISANNTAIQTAAQWADIMTRVMVD